MQRDPPFVLSPFAFNADLSGEGGFTGTRLLSFASLLFSQGVAGAATTTTTTNSTINSDMDLSKVGEKILSSVRSARSLALLPPSSDRPQVPARAAAAAAVARALAGIPPHQRHTLASSSEQLSSIYGSNPHGQVVDDIEEEFYEEEFDPVRHILEHLPCEEIDVSYFEEKATLRLAQLDRISERLARQVMEHHEEMVKGMHLVSELEKDLNVANVICMNGRRHLTSSMNEVSRDLVVTTCSRKKQVLLDMIPTLTELRHALLMQASLENHVAEGNFSKAFQVLSEYLQLLDSLSELSVIQEMSRGVEVWLGKTLQKLDSLLLGVCQDFKEDGYITVVDAYALIGDISGLAEKMQSFFMQEVLSETHYVLKNILLEDQETSNGSSSRLTYSDMCHVIPESKFRQCLLATLNVLFKLMTSYYAIMSFQPENKLRFFQRKSKVFRRYSIYYKHKLFDKISVTQTLDGKQINDELPGVSLEVQHIDSEIEKSYCLTADNVVLSQSTYRDSAKAGTTSANFTETNGVIESRNAGYEASSSDSPWFQLRKDATIVVSQTLVRGRKNLWQLITSRASVLLSSASVCSASIHQFLRNYEDLNVFILAGEAFCGAEAVEFRRKLRNVCENYFAAFHRQNIYALKMVLEKETWLKLPPETLQVVSFSGLLGDGAALIVSSDRKSSNKRAMHSNRTVDAVDSGSKKSGFSYWLNSGNPFLAKLNFKENHGSFSPTWSDSGDSDGKLRSDRVPQQFNDASNQNGRTSFSEDENEDLHADFIDEDSQLPSRISKPSHSRHFSSQWNGEELTAQTGSSLCLLKLLDKYARLMQKLEIINVEFIKGICQLFGIFFHFVYETFVQQNTTPGGKGLTDPLSYRLRTSLSQIMQDCDQWIKPQSLSFPSSSSPTSVNTSLSHMDVMPTSPLSNNVAHPFGASLGLKERCVGAETISLVARLLHRSRAHLQMMLLQSNAAVVEDFFVNMVDSVPELTQHIHRSTARLLLHINGFSDRVANAKWEVKELGMDHNGYVDLLLGKFKHYKTTLAQGGIPKEVQDLLLEYGFEIVAETLIEGLSRVKRCSDEGRALMSLDLQVLINGLRHFVPIDVKPKFQIVETFIKAYYLPETEYVHWARAHPEYNKSQIVGLINLVATMKSWRRKTRLEVLEKIEGTG